LFLNSNPLSPALFAGGRAGEPDGKTIGRIVARQKKIHRKAR
jgi:hypothetical protein